jgi:hypothetical protein
MRDGGEVGVGRGRAGSEAGRGRGAEGCKRGHDGGAAGGQMEGVKDGQRQEGGEGKRGPIVRVGVHEVVLASVMGDMQGDAQKMVGVSEEGRIGHLGSVGVETCGAQGRRINAERIGMDAWDGGAIGGIEGDGMAAGGETCPEIVDEGLGAAEEGRGDRRDERRE